jgi:hypothetical protein
MVKSSGGSSDHVQFSIGYPKTFNLSSEISDEVKIEVVNVSKLKEEGCVEKDDAS